MRLSAQGICNHATRWRIAVPACGVLRFASTTERLATIYRGTAMQTAHYIFLGLSATSLLASTAIAQNPAPAAQAPAPMSFFITSAGKGDGANLGGLAGADARCAELAAASGTAVAPNRQWRAYLSGTAPDGRPIHARDRIGTGPWHNAKGALIAATVADLHGDIVRDRNQIN